MASQYFTYFAFGSNMLTKRIHINCPSAVRVDVGKLEGYQLEFSDDIERWHGAVASITEKINSNVYGVLWEISMQHLRNLDKQEGVHLGQYKPIDVVISTLTSGIRNARTYQLITPDRTNNIPSWVYLDVIIRGATENGVPENYIKKLKDIEHNGYRGYVDINV